MEWPCCRWREKAGIFSRASRRLIEHRLGVNQCDECDNVGRKGRTCNFPGEIKPTEVQVEAVESVETRGVARFNKERRGRGNLTRKLRVGARGLDAISGLGGRVP